MHTLPCYTYSIECNGQPVRSGLEYRQIVIGTGSDYELLDPPPLRTPASIACACFVRNRRSRINPSRRRPQGRRLLLLILNLMSSPPTAHRCLHHPRTRIESLPYWRGRYWSELLTKASFLLSGDHEGTFIVPLAAIDVRQHPRISTFNGHQPQIDVL